MWHVSCLSLDVASLLVEGRARRITVILAATLSLLFAVMIARVAVPVLLAAVFAILLAPWHARLAGRMRRLGRPRAQKLAALAITTAVLALVIGPIALIAVGVVSAVARLADVDAPVFGAGGAAGGWVDGALETIGDRLSALGISVSPEGLSAGLAAQGRTLLKAIGGTFAGWLASTPMLVLALFLFTATLFFFLRDGARVTRWLRRVLPLTPADSASLFTTVRGAVNAVVLGSLVTGAVQAGLALVFLLVLRVPGAVLWATLALVMSFIPTIGTAPVTLGATLYLVTTGRVAAAIAMAAGVVLIGTVDNVVRPWVTSQRFDLHPGVVLVSIFGGLFTIGAAGVILGPIFAAIVKWGIDAATRHATPPVAPGRRLSSHHAAHREDRDLHQPPRH
jgi:predicted PurR-regulated permease PerM